MANKTKYPAEILTTDEMRALLRQCSRRAPTGIRDRALLTLLYRSGLRIGEALALKPADIDAKAGTVRVLHGKNDKARTVGIDDGALAVIQVWMDARKQRGLAKAGSLLFTTLEGKPLSYDQASQMIKRRARHAGIDKRVHLHALRHTHAAELAAEGVPMNVIQQQLGHDSLATTDTYLRHIAPVEVIAVGRARQWADESAVTDDLERVMRGRDTIPLEEVIAHLGIDTPEDSAEANAAEPTPPVATTAKQESAAASSEVGCTVRAVPPPVAVTNPQAAVPFKPRRKMGNTNRRTVRAAPVQPGQRIAFTTENKSDQA